MTCENHQTSCGLGGAVAELLSEQMPTPMGRIGSQDKFGQVGTLEFLLKEYEMTAEDILKKAAAVIAKKR